MINTETGENLAETEGKEKVEISKYLLHLICIYVGSGFNGETPRESLADDSIEAELYDALFDEFPFERLDKLYPGEFEDEDLDDPDE